MRKSGYALNNLFQAFSAWGQTPDDSNARQNVIDQAASVSQAFQETASGLTTVAQNTDQQLQQTVGQVNQLVGQIGQLNSQILNGNRNDAGLDAEMHADLEQLSNYVPITATKQADGSMTVLLNGQTDLLVGAQQYQLSYSLQQAPNATYANGPPLAHIQAADGTDVTSRITTGQLGALLNVRNQILPSYIGSGMQVGDLNTMAKQFADTVNGLLESGTQAGASTPGIPLFTYASQGGTDPTKNDTSAAQTIAVNAAMTPSQLAASLPGPPVQSNGVALALSQLANPQSSAEEIDGESFTAFYGDMATRVGNALNAATNQQQVSQASVAQAQNLRQQASGVDLNSEAMKAVEFERAYEANARLVSILNQITEDQINILSGTS